MKTYEITNENVSYYVDSIGLPLNATEREIDDALADAEMDISIDWGVIGSHLHMRHYILTMKAPTRQRLERPRCAAIWI